MARAAATRKPQPQPPSPWADLAQLRAALAVEDFPSALLTRLGGLARSKLSRSYLDRAGLRWPEWRLLTLIARFSPMAYPVLVQQSTMDKGQISLTIRTLAARRWVTLDGTDAPPAGATRRSARTIAITAAGREVIEQVLPDARRAQAQLLARLSEDDRVALHRLLRLTLGALETLPDET
jgi:DNA-binding MarR family transcriptional regulator